MTAPSLHSLNASFYEREDLRKKQQRMTLLMNGFDADQRCLKDGDVVTVWNEHGEVLFWLEISEKVPVGVVVAEGVWWTEFAPGKRTVNALVSQRLTDEGGGSTFYDNSVEVTKGRQEIGDHDLRKG
jgi:anaerobic selenocysteine-containing dehydrogenase